jgi:hypothetical protein
VESIAIGPRPVPRRREPADWHNRGTTIARVLAVTVGVYPQIEGGPPVG